MPLIITEIIKNSIAEEIELEKGDEILSINKIVPKDLIEYRYIITDELIDLEIKKQNGDIEEIEIEKDFDEDLGIVFETAVFDKLKLCKNHCIFCFVDQQPKGLRKTLYVKDDDYRLSFLQGTYITMTNLTDEDKNRIASQHLAPLYVSLHTTNPELRAKMLRNPNAANIINDLKWLKKNDIPVHLQIVLCPEYNDKEELQRTLDDLLKYKKIILSLAIVPIGLTKFSKSNIKSVDKSVAWDTIKRVENFNKKIKRQVAAVSDEIFLIAEEPIPEKKYYNNFAQIEDGVGTIRLTLDDFEKQKKRLPNKLKEKTSVYFYTSKAAKYAFTNFVAEFNKIENLSAKLVIAESNFLGDKISVAGLITGGDLLSQLKPIKNEIKNLVIPTVMLQPFTDKFLDDVTLEEVKKELDCNICVVRDIYSTKEIVDFIKSFK